MRFQSILDFVNDKGTAGYFYCLCISLGGFILSLEPVSINLLESKESSKEAGSTADDPSENNFSSSSSLTFI